VFYLKIQYTTRKIHTKPHLGLRWHIFHVFTRNRQVKMLMISLISCLTLELYLYLLVYDQNIFGSSSKVFGNLCLSSVVFGNLWKFSENVRKRSCGLQTIFVESSEIFGKSSKTLLSEYIYIIFKNKIINGCL